jgi:UPF0716 protein FxsA
MFGILLLLFILIPVAEISLFIQIGQRIGIFPTIFLVVLTGIVGAYLTRIQGFRIWFQIQQQLQQGKFPGDSLIDGLLILVGGLTLLTPGFITDCIGLLCLLPPTRNVFRAVIKRSFEKRIHTV